MWIRLARHKWSKAWANIEDPVVPLERNLYDYPKAGLLWERRFEEASLELGWGKCTKWSSCSSKNKNHPSVDLDDIKMAGKEQITAPMWKKLKHVDISEPTSFLDHVYLGCTQRECKWNETITEQFQNHVLFRLETLKNYPGWEKPHEKTVAWSYHVAGDAQGASSGTVNGQTRKCSNCAKF